MPSWRSRDSTLTLCRPRFHRSSVPADLEWRAFKPPRRPFLPALGRQDCLSPRSTEVEQSTVAGSFFMVPALQYSASLKSGPHCCNPKTGARPAAAIRFRVLVGEIVGAP